MSKWACLLAASVLVACVETPRYAQVDIVLQCDAELLPSATGVRLRVFQGRSNVVLRDDIALIADGFTFPSTVTVVPIENDPNREFWVFAELLQDGTVIATQQLISNFVADSVRRLTLRFSAMCPLGCGPLQNCVESRCESACFGAVAGELKRQICEEFVDPCVELDDQDVVVYCESFEEERTQQDPIFDPGSSFERSSEVFHGSGGHAAHIYAPMGAENAHFMISAFGSAPSGSRWMRSWWRLPSGSIDVTFFALESDFQRIGATVDLSTTTEGNVAASALGFAFDIIEPFSIPQDEWFCIETHIDFEAESIDYFVNSLNTTTIFGQIPDALHRARFGAVPRNATAPENYDIYIDDIVFSNTRVGCN